MDAFVWSDKFVTGIGPIDDQHQRLVELINRFGELSAQGDVAGATIASLLSELFAYAHTHFLDEEALMADAGVDERFQHLHHDQHQQFLTQVTLMNSSLGGGASLPLFRFLVGWLAFHILGTDQQLAAQLRHLAEGKSAAEAFALDVHGADRSAGILLDSVDDLMRVVAARNQELVAINQTLEARVAQRTAELSSRNAELERTLADLRRTQAELLQAQKLESVGRLAAGVAHEINTPVQFVADGLFFLQGAWESLAALSGRCAQLKVEAAAAQVSPRLLAELEEAESAADLGYLKAEIPATLDRCTRGLERVASLVRSLKDFARPDGDEKVPIDLNAALAQTLELSGREYAGVQIETHFGPLPPVPCHPSLLKQVFLSLLTNAAQAIDSAAKGEGRIQIHTRQEGDWVRISIGDNGTGIAPAVAEHLFEPFFTTRQVGKGTGQGLAVARSSVVDKHAGQLTFQTAVGAGTTFEIALPVSSPPPRAPVKMPASS